MKKARIAEQIASQLEAMISRENLQPNDRLPAERKLAEQLGISRPSLREAIQILTSKGLVYSRQGGGTYIKNTVAKSLSDPMLALFQENPEYRFDVLEIRHALEGNAAYYAALRATEEDKQNIADKFDAMIALHGNDNPMDEARADAAFHLSIVEASHNMVLLHVMRGLFDLLQNSISHNLDKLYTIPQLFELLSDQHRTLMEAVLNSDPEAARTAAEQHLIFVEEAIKKIDADEARRQRSRHRHAILGSYAR
ncbi:MAG: transcriptional regulator LldR [Proteobacteria bacterium]|nr:MAG: transcriptional regulator LldR [Pseudomonadota bacterium]